jgi:hypothetical protein
MKFIGISKKIKICRAMRFVLLRWRSRSSWGGRSLSTKSILKSLFLRHSAESNPSIVVARKRYEEND